MSISSEILDHIVAGTSDKPPFVDKLEIPKIDGWEPGRVWTHWPVNPQMFQVHGALFGGYLAALADSVLGLATLSTMNDDEIFTTSDLRVSFFRQVRSGTLNIEAKVVNRGRSMVHVEVEFHRDDGKLVGKASATQVVLPRPA